MTDSHMSAGLKTLSPIVKWLDDGEIDSVYSARSWNDLAEEKTKEWWIADGSPSARARLARYLDETALIDDFRLAERHLLSEVSREGLAVADLAAGIGWTSSLLSRSPKVASVHAVDISRHRLELLFPQAVAMFEGQPEKLRRYLGSFYELGFADASMDVVMMSAAFHHASQPLRLLAEIDRVLKPGGHLLLIGENFVGPMAIARRVIKTLLRERRWCAEFHELFPPDDQWGDHYYRTGDYRLFFRLLGYEIRCCSVQRKRSAAIFAAKAAS